jgi:Cof subfamily protein (haloacid dehalogenase superfamily)
MTPIRLVVSDIDGTLVTPDKVITPRAMAAVKALDAAGVAFSVVSARPPRGMAPVASALHVRQPYAGFNGGALVGPDGALIAAERLPREVARTVLAHLAERKVATWVFADDGWFLTSLREPEIDRERRAIGFEPTVVSDFDRFADRIDKIVGVSDDPAGLATVESEAQAWVAGHAIAQRSQTYYLDFTALTANKGHAVQAICQAASFKPEETAVIGDMSNDIAMFRVAGFSVAMGQSSEIVKAEAKAVTAANTEDGFAKAIEDLILPKAAR